MRSIQWHHWALPVLSFLAVIIRVGSFFPSVLDHDESTYFLIGKGLLAGQTYLVDSIDTKPIGIFLIYALMNWLGGSSIFLGRLFTALVVGFTAFLLYRLGRRAGGHERVGWAAGIGYVLLTSIFKFYGLSPNTELFFVPLSIGAILLTWGANRRIYHFVLAGLLLGMGFMIKYVIAADALALGLFLLWQGLRQQNLVQAVFRQCLPLTLAFLVPPLLTYNYYVNIGQADAFLFYTFEVTSRYPVEKSWGALILYTLDFFGRYSPFVFLAIFALRERLTTDRYWQNFLLLWLICATIMTLLPGKTFGHYQIQLMPPLALLAGSWFHPLRTGQSWLRRRSPRWGWGSLAVVVLGLSVGLYSYYQHKLDGPRIVARILKEKMRPGDLVYTGNYHQMVYYLIDQPSLTPYIHSSLLFYPHHVVALGINLAEETHQIIDIKKPRFVLLRTSHPTNLLTNSIYQNYHLQDTLPDKVMLLERN